MAKKKRGLHKKVSSIFDGIDVPKDSAQGSGGAAGQPPNLIDKGLQQHKDTGAEGPGGRIAEKPKPPAKRPPAAPGLTARGDYRLSGSVPGVSNVKGKVKLAVLPLLFIALIFILVKQFKPAKSENPGPEPAAQRSPAVQRPQVEANGEEQSAEVNDVKEINWETPKVYSDKLPDIMEPGRGVFKPFGDVAGATNQDHREPYDDDAALKGQELYDSIEIKSILFSEFSRSVVIDNRILYEGDTVLGAKIIKIDKNSIEFEKNGMKFSKPLIY